MSSTTAQLLRTTGRGLFTLLIIAGVMLGSTGPATAHAALSDSNPQDGATLTQTPPRVTLTFNEQIVDYGAVVAVTGSDSDTYHLDDLALDGKTLSVGVKPFGPPGTYTVAFRVVSSDSHPITGQINFSYTPAAASPSAVTSAAASISVQPATSTTTSLGASSTDTPASAPSAVRPSTNAAESPTTSAPATATSQRSTTDVQNLAPAAQPSAAAAADDNRGSGTGWWVVAIGIVLFAITAAAVVYALRRPRSA